MENIITMKIGRNIELNSYLKNFFNRYSMNDLIGFINHLSGMHVLIIGEAVIDEYIYGEVIGKTNKSPSLVFSPHNSETFAGVPMNVANHLSSFCNHVDLMVMIGNDGKEDFIKYHLHDSGLKTYKWETTTIIKKRYIASYNNEKVFEVYDFVPVKFDDTSLITDIVVNIDKYDLVIVCDSGHGMLTYDTRTTLKDGAKFLAVNTQTNAGNIGTHSAKKYTDRRHNIYVCVNEREFILANHETWDKHSCIDDVLRELDGNMTAVTTGPSGCKICKNGTVVNVPAFAENIVDPVGAGDAFLSLSSPMAYANFPLEIVGFFGNVAGAMKTSYQGNKEFITKDNMYNYILNLMERAK